MTNGDTKRGIGDWLYDHTIGAIHVPEAITIVFDKIGDFIEGTVLFFLNAYVIFIILLFFALIILLFIIPIRVYPIYRKNKKFFDKILRIRYE